MTGRIGVSCVWRRIRPESKPDALVRSVWISGAPEIAIPASLRTFEKAAAKYRGGSGTVTSPVHVRLRPTRPAATTVWLPEFLLTPTRTLWPRAVTTFPISERRGGPAGENPRRAG